MREFGKICADVETVAGAVLAGQLDFEATVIDERLDLIDNGVGCKAVKATFDKMRAAERAGVEAAFFDVHNADKRRLAKDVVMHGPRHIVIANASAVLFSVTRNPTK